MPGIPGSWADDYPIGVPKQAALDGVREMAQRWGTGDWAASTDPKIAADPVLKDIMAKGVMASSPPSTRPDVPWLAPQVLPRASSRSGSRFAQGWHTGEVERRNGDIGGIAVNLAARVSDLAAAGEVLVTCTVTDLVVGSDLTFETLGDHKVKGIDRPWELWRFTDLVGSALREQ